ncbi:heavy metal translocating P-type ATPase [Leifsonia sp. Root227]|uniref:heavy metal translocating P-type ATPase n=1 Tax=Leifsonia sp. Root227 TaxID=1736496 RepID=UPI000ADF91C3|nr:heavy metal translocating P-type ATPase [Leifsonia sp. Root227]
MTGATTGATTASGASGPVELDLAIDGMTCASCVARVEKRLGRLDGVTATVNLATERARVTAPASIDPALLVAEVQKAGYGAHVIEAAEPPREADSGAALRIRLIVSAALTVPVVLLAMVPAWQFWGWQWVSLVLATPVVLWGGWPFHRAAAVNLRHGAATMDTLVSLGTAAAYLWSLWALVFGTAGELGMHHPFTFVAEPGSASGAIYLEVAAGVTTFLLLGRFVEERSKRRAGAALRDLLQAGAKDVAILTDDERERRVPVSALAVGDRFVVRPGERIAADGVVLDGAAAVDTSAMTGESVPVEVAGGGTVAGGTIAHGGTIVVRASRVGADTQLARMAKLVEEAQLGKAGIQRLADRISGVFVPVVIALALATFLVWMLVGGGTSAAVSAAVAVLIVACPCALGLATPTALLVGTGRAAQLGILITGPEVLERTGRIDTIVFDKTGTLTTGTMTVTGVVTADGAEEDSAEGTDALLLAASAERGSEHPIGRAIAAAVDAHAPVSGFRAVAGFGVTALVDGRQVTVARVDDSAGLPDTLAAAVRASRAAGATAVLVTVDDRAVAVLSVSDPLRADAEEAIGLVRGLGLEPVVLSGDHEETVRAVVGPLRIRNVVGGATPEGKAETIARLQEDGHSVAMVGDGVNDAAALAAADLGIAMGSGSDVAIEAGDLTLLRSDPVLVADAIRLSRRTVAIIRGNLFWAFAYNVAALPVAALGLLNPMIAGAAMAFSSVFVVLNSLRLRSFAGRTISS